MRKLQSGRKSEPPTRANGVFKRKSLFRINVVATEYGKPPNDPWLSTPTQFIDAAQIKVMKRIPNLSCWRMTNLPRQTNSYR